MMLKHDLRLALRSFRRNPILTALTVSAIAAGIGAAMISITLYHARAGHPLWWKEHQLFAVTLDARGSDHKGEELQRHPEYPPNQVTYQDARALYRSDIPKHSLMMYRTAEVVDPDKAGIKPFGAIARVTTADFFSMFDVPMRYGAGWGRSADTTPDPVVVLSERLNARVFNGANSVGRTITLGNRQFRVVGVIDEWMPQPKFYDVTTGPFDIGEDLYMPFGWSTALKLQPFGNINCVTPNAKVGGFEDLLNTDCVFMQYWVEITGGAALRRYQQFLDNYTNNQRQYGRFVRPTNNHLDDIPAWLNKNDVVGDDSRIEVVLGLVFLGVCIVNTVGLMLAKFLGSAPVTGLRRALGASRKQIMHQHLVEVVLIAMLGGAAGLVLARLGLWAIKVMTYVPRPDNNAAREALANSLSHMDYRMVVLAVGVSVLTGILAGLYPAWRIGRAAPASFLKAQ
jgi:putative ABC transport system permease protein